MGEAANPTDKPAAPAAAPAPAPGAPDTSKPAPGAPDTSKPAPGEKIAGGGEGKAGSAEKGKGQGGADNSANQAGTGAGFGQIAFMLAAFIALMYFMLIRPQRKREKQRQEMLGKLKVGDRVLTAGGVIGEIAEMNNDEVTLKIDARKDVRLRMRRWAIAGPADEAATERAVKEQSGS
jgi:preprotein translocase subunit YajC